MVTKNLSKIQNNFKLIKEKVCQHVKSQGKTNKKKKPKQNKTKQKKDQKNFTRMAPGAKN